jgi:small subunit ribosomal protein S17e
MSRLTNDFHVNKRIIDDISQIQTKRLRNKIAGFTTHLMKRIEKKPVRGISLRLQEEVSEPVRGAAALSALPI